MGWGELERREGGEHELGCKNNKQKKKKNRKFKMKPCIFIRSSKVKSSTLTIQKCNWALVFICHFCCSRSWDRRTP